MNDVAILDSGNDIMLSTAAAAMPELFVINLCASMTPMPAVPKNLKGFEKYKLYQVSRQEDGRRRFRLRLGFFTSEADAEWVLNSVRGLYPAAFTGCVTNEDLRFTGDALPARVAPVAAAAPPIEKPIATKPAIVTTPVAATRPAVAAMASAPIRTPTPSVAASSAAASVVAVKSAAPAASKPAVMPPSNTEPNKVRGKTGANNTEPAMVLSASTPAATPQPAANANSAHQPFHVGRGVDLPEINLELTDEFEVLAAPKSASPTLAPSPPQVKQPTAAAFSNTGAYPATPKADGPIRSASIIAPPKVVDDYVPILDTTLTIRTLTKTEADDPNRQKWFAVQLALSEQPINLDTMPKLDIFAAYTLYCVATMEGGSVKHALRLGFFRESVSAEAVMGYLKAFFNQPTINQISTAEFDRFADSKLKQKPMPAAEGKVVNLEAKRPATAKPLPPIAAPQTTPKPVVKTAVSKAPVVTPPARPQSFLSRLIGRQLD